MITFHPTITELDIAEIKVLGTRLRPVSEAAVDALIALIEEYGFTSPILVRKQRKDFVLLDGAHRLEAITRLGRKTIPVTACTCTDVDAALMEAGQNLPGGMGALDDAVFLAAWKRAYLKKHPETARGVAGAAARWEDIQPNNSSFAKMVAARRGVTERNIQKIVTSAEQLDPHEITTLKSAPKIAISDLIVIGKIADPNERTQVVLKLAGGNAKNAATARKQWRAEQGEAAPLEDPVEAAFQALSKAWARAGMAARKRFLLERASEVLDAQNTGVALADWAQAVEPTVKGGA
jgi:ParB family transcriptional regulator, chromosome partitioning protein